jgi:uncharacterized repeat protein (TIGR04076 family)
VKKCKITVLKRTLNSDLAKEYCKSQTGLCPCFIEGDTFFAGFDQPDKFCGWAWNDIYRFVTVLLSRGNFSSGVFEGWMKKDNEMIVCCTDAIRPVIFKIELIEDGE